MDGQAFGIAVDTDTNDTSWNIGIRLYNLTTPNQNQTNKQSTQIAIKEYEVLLRNGGNVCNSEDTITYIKIE